MDREERALYIFVLFFSIFFGLYSIWRAHLWESLMGKALDLTIFYDSLMNTIDGRGFFFNEDEFKMHGVYSHFGVHNQPILFLILPVFYLFPYRETLLILQAVAISLGAVPVYWLANDLLSDKKEGLVFAIFYLLNPLLHGLIRYEFHPVSFAVPLILLLALYWEREEYKKAFLVALGILSVKEDAGLILMALGSFYLLKEEGLSPRKWLQRWREIILIGMGLAWILVSILVVIPYFRPEGYIYGELYQGGIRGEYVILFVATVLLIYGFLPLRRPLWFLTSLPLWMELLLSTRVSMVVLGFQYHYMLAPFLLILSLYVYAFDGFGKYLIRFGIVASLMFSPVIGLVPSPVVVGEGFMWILSAKIHVGL